MIFGVAADADFRANVVAVRLAFGIGRSGRFGLGAFAFEIAIRALRRSYARNPKSCDE